MPLLLLSDHRLHPGVVVAMEPGHVPGAMPGMVPFGGWVARLASIVAAEEPRGVVAGLRTRLHGGSGRLLCRNRVVPKDLRVSLSAAREGACRKAHERQQPAPNHPIRSATRTIACPPRRLRERGSQELRHPRHKDKVR